MLSAKPSMRQTVAEAMASIDVIQQPGPNGRREASIQTSREEPRNRTHPSPCQASEQRLPSRSLPVQTEGI